MTNPTNRSDEMMKPLPTLEEWIAEGFDGALYPYANQRPQAIPVSQAHLDEWIASGFNPIHYPIEWC